jgi:hypothetical protein
MQGGRRFKGRMGTRILDADAEGKTTVRSHGIKNQNIFKNVFKAGKKVETKTKSQSQSERRKRKEKKKKQSENGIHILG